MLFYTIKDRSNDDKYKLSIVDSLLSYETTNNVSYDSEPIVRDTVNSSTYWKILINDGQLGLEQTTTVRNDKVYLYDTEQEIYYQLFVNDGQFGYQDTIPVSTDIAKILNLKLDKYIDANIQIKKYTDIKINIEGNNGQW